MSRQATRRNCPSRRRQKRVLTPSGVAIRQPTNRRGGAPMLSRRIPLACPICGGENFFSPKRKPEHDDYVTCMGCGTETLYGDLQSRADARVKQVREVEKLKQT